MENFRNLGLPEDLARVAQELGFTEPTPVQRQAIPLLLEARDLIGQSRTGSGKTAAFGLPALAKLELRPRRLQVLVLCPTRELCAQVARELRRLGRRLPGLQVLILAGGAPIFPQLQALEKGVHIAVGTPGRVLDHLVRGTLELRGLRTVVLDEADRMLDMGFEEDMQRILGHAPAGRQTVLFSATFPRSIEALSRRYQRDPARVTVETDPEEKVDIRQELYEATPEKRARALLSLLTSIKPESSIVFCNFKASAFALARELAAAGLSVGALHGDLEQNDRDRIMAQFRNGSLRTLIATDVAARGIDVPNLALVINYELPPQSEVYVHRVGRTGRAGQKGHAISFYSPNERPKVGAIERETGVKLERKTLEAFANTALDMAPSPTATAAMRTLYISGGRKDKVRPGDILGALTGEAAGLDASEVGRIEIHDRFSYVAVASPIANLALARLRAGRIKGRKFRVEAVK